MTRYEVIKNLSVEDMVEWLDSNGFCTLFSLNCYKEISCEECVKQYLYKI